MKIAKFISICIFITFCSCNNKGVYENCISFKLTDFLDKGEIKDTDLQFSKEVMRPTALHIEDSILILYLQPIITQYFTDNKSEIWSLSLIAHSKR